MKCSKCNIGASHNLGSTPLCEYHYWKEKPGLTNWRTYAKAHPQRVAAWRRWDPKLNQLMKEEEQNA